MALIGLGLIGSSLSHAIRRGGLAKRISGSAAHPRRRAKTAERLKLCDSVHADPADAVAGADLVILCSPVGSFGGIAEAIGPGLGAGLHRFRRRLGQNARWSATSPRICRNGVHFIPGHPIAGTEYSGPESGFAELFDGRWCMLTPPPETDADAVARLKRFWEACGSSVEIMTPEHHDLVLAITSHVPHLIAYNIVGTASDLETVTEKEVVKFSASGFRDFTRIAASDPTMWRDVFLNNKDAVLEMLGRFNEDLAALQRAIRWGDGDALFELFTRTRAIRRAIIDAGQETPAPDFGRPHGAAAEKKKSA